MLLLDKERATALMPVTGYFIEGGRVVSDKLELQAEWKGFGYDVHDVNTFVYGIGPKEADKNELYAVRIKGSPKEPVNEAFVTTARRLLSFNNSVPYRQTADLDYDPNIQPLRPEVVDALSKAVTVNNGSGKRIPIIVPR